jgi:hypothetical protein
VKRRRDQGRGCRDERYFRPVAASRSRKPVACGPQPVFALDSNAPFIYKRQKIERIEYQEEEEEAS